MFTCGPGFFSSSAISVPPLLDLYPGATAYYSLRRGRSAYLGPSIRVQTSAVGNATLDIGFDVAGNLDTAVLLNFLNGASGYVTIWYDQSGNGYNASTSSMVGSPSIAFTGTLITTNGKIAIFAPQGVQQYFTTAFSITQFSATRTASTAIVHRSTTVAPASSNLYGLHRNLAYSYQSGHSSQWRNANLAMQWGTGTTGAFSFPNFQNQQVANSNTTALMCYQTNVNGTAGTFNMAIDGVAQTLSNVNGTMPLTSYMNTGSGNHRLVLFADSDNTNTVNSLYLGYMSEAAFWATDQLANQAGIRANQQAYWGTP